jgi:hypothetical protein
MLHDVLLITPRDSRDILVSERPSRKLLLQDLMVNPKRMVFIDIVSCIFLPLALFEVHSQRLLVYAISSREMTI